MEIEEHKALLNSLSTTVQKACHTLRVVKDSEIEEETMLELSELNGLIEPEIGESNQLIDENKEHLLNGVYLGWQVEEAIKYKKRTKKDQTNTLLIIRKYLVKDAAKSLGG